MRESLSQYIIQNSNLVDPRNPRFAPFLYSANRVALSRSTTILRLSLNQRRVISYFYRATNYWIVCWNLATPITRSVPTVKRRLGNRCHRLKLIFRKGKPPKIHVVLEKRQGRKTVTRFWGLEAFFLNPNELAEELRNTCATSASVGGLSRLP